MNFLKVHNLSYKIPYSDSILENINIEASVRDYIGILGPNGAGETTLLDLMMVFVSPFRGR